MSVAQYVQDTIGEVDPESFYNFVKEGRKYWDAYGNYEYRHQPLQLPFQAGKPKKRKQGPAPDPKKMKGAPGKSVNIQNALAGRAVMRKSGKNPKVKKGKIVKVSKTLRAKVKKVMEAPGNRFNGQYNVTCHGTIGQVGWNTTLANGSVFFGPNAAAVQGMGNLGTPYHCVPIYNNSFGTACTWWAGHAAGSMNPSGNQLFHQMWNFFSPLQFLDAASKLWNEKYDTSSTSWYASQDNNVQLQRRLDTGAGNALLGSGDYPAIVGDLVLGVKSSGVKFTLKNNSGRKQTIQFYHCTPKLKYPTQDAFTDLVTTVQMECTGVNLNGQTQSAQTRNVLFKTQTTNNATQPSHMEILQHPLFDPKDSVQWSSRWKYQLKEVVIQPGEECVHYIKGPSNCQIDFAKLIQKTASTAFYPVMVKGYSVQVFCRIKPDMAFDQTTSTSAFFSQADAAAYRANIDPGPPVVVTSAKLVQPVSIQVDYVYDLRCPEQAGFITEGGAGAPQWLNLKRKIKQFDSFSVDPNVVATHTGVRVNNEETATTYVDDDQMT